MEEMERALQSAVKRVDSFLGIQISRVKGQGSGAFPKVWGSVGKDKGIIYFNPEFDKQFFDCGKAFRR